MSNELFIGMVCAVLSVGLAVMLATKFFSVRGSEEGDVENCGLPENHGTLSDAIKIQYEMRLLMGPLPRWGGGEVTVTSNRCNYCGTTNEQNHGTCCKCGAPLWVGRNNYARYGRISN